jgi:hypothetical protein
MTPASLPAQLLRLANWCMVLRAWRVEIVAILRTGDSKLVVGIRCRGVTELCVLGSLQAVWCSFGAFAGR